MSEREKALEALENALMDDEITNEDIADALWRTRSNNVLIEMIESWRRRCPEVIGDPRCA